MITVNQQKLKKAIIDYLNSDGEKDPGLVSMGKLLLETIEEKEENIMREKIAYLRDLGLKAK